MRIGLVVAGGVFFAGVTGCSIHPLPEDFARDNTFKIVEKIRCEARDVLVRALHETLNNSEYADLASRRLSADLKSSARLYSELVKTDVNPDLYLELLKFRHAGVALEFTFTITETNTNAADASFKMPLNHGTFTLGLDIGGTKIRTSERIVKISSSLGGLVQDTTLEEECPEPTKAGKNIVYPITGEVGFAELFSTYFKLVHNTQTPMGTYSDELTFTTSIGAGAKPGVTLTDFVPKKLRLASASADISADRKDVHKLAIVIVDRRAEVVPPTKKRIALAEDIVLEVKIPRPRKSARDDYTAKERRKTAAPSFDRNVRSFRSDRLLLKSNREADIGRDALNRLDQLKLLNREKQLDDLVDQ